jgi:SAM-dependent methyltransferase
VTTESAITDHHRRYWHYEYDVAGRFMVPLLERWGVRLAGASVLDAGCGEGGGVCAIHDAGSRCSGFDIDAVRVDLAVGMKGDRDITFAVGSLYDGAFPFSTGLFDLVILHDVFEHLDHKEQVLRTLAGLLQPGGRILITFPPYFSAFGAHQQHLRTWYGRLPFFHMLPFATTILLGRMKNEFPSVVNEVRKLSRLKMGMRGFEAIVRSSGLCVERCRPYLISPNHIRFGLHPVPAGIVGRIPLAREVLCTGVVYLLSRG